MDFRRITSLQISGRSVQKLTLDGRQVWSAEKDTTNYLTFTSQQFEATLKLTATGSPDPIELEFRTGDEAGHYHQWETYNVEQDVPLMVGERVQFRGDNSTFSKDSNNYYQFQMSGEFLASGSVMTLLDKTNERRDIPNFAFYALFRDCSALKSAPTIDVDNVGAYACSDMFNHTSLMVAPELPATRVSNNSYANMFSNCGDLTVAPPELPADPVTGGSYAWMFENSPNIETAPKIRAQALADQCFYQMFSALGSRINYIEVNFSSWSGGLLPTGGWLNGNYGGGVMVGPQTLGNNTSIPRGAGNCPGGFVFFAKDIDKSIYVADYEGATSVPSVGSNIIEGILAGISKLDRDFEIRVPANLYDEWIAAEGWSQIAEHIKKIPNYLTFTAETDSSSVRLARYGNPHAISLEYRTNASPIWNAYSIGNYISLNQGGWAQFRGDNQAFTLNANHNYKFEVSGNVAASGNIMSICDSTCESTTIPADDMFECLFEAQTNLTKAPELPATTLTTRAYRLMFHGCTSLREAPELPATDMADYCYAGMFEGCTALTEAPYLPATELATRSYEYMFQNCTSLSTVKVAFTSWLANNSTSYWMNNVAPTGTFICPATLPQESGVHRIPEGWTVVNPVNYLTFTALQNSSTIALNAVGTPDPISLEYRTNHEDTWHPYTIGDTLSMMSGWTLELRGDNATFSKASGNYYKFVMTGKYEASGSVMTLLDKTDTRRDVPTYCFYRLFEQCSALRTPPELPATTLDTYCYATMFLECSSLTQAPELPATTMATSCYGSMFWSCTSLTRAPELPATKIATNCYVSMFKNCANLSYISVKFTKWTETIMVGTNNWVDGIAPTGEFHCPTALSESRGVNRIPEGWTIIRDVA